MSKDVRDGSAVTEKPKMYFVCDGADDWWMCYGVLSNGFCFGQHLCSHPGYAASDLYHRRTERKDALKEVFGFQWEPGEGETIVVRSMADIPAWWASHEGLQAGLKPQYDQYAALLKAREAAAS